MRIKKIIFLITAIACFPFLTFATSGACSGHGGVSCSSGADWDGSVICNDGWKNSSVSYSSMSECSTISTGCSSSDWSSIQEKYNISGLKAKIQSEMDKIEIANKEIDSLESEKTIEINNLHGRGIPQQLIDGKENAIEKKYNALKLKLYSDINSASLMAQAYQSNLSMIMSSARDECNAVGLDNYYKNQTELLRKSIELKKELDCPSNSDYQNSKCVCRDGFIMIGDKCKSYNEICQNSLGVNSYGDKDYCYCSSGYEMNSDKSKCIPSVSCPINSKKINNQCVCNEGYIMKNNVCLTYTQDCKNNFGEHVYGQKGNNNSSCFCDNGYEWNTSKTSCIQKQNNNDNEQKINSIEVKEKSSTNNSPNQSSSNQSLGEFKLAGNEKIRGCGGSDCKVIKFGSTGTATILEKNGEWFKIKINDNGEIIEGWINSSLVPDNITTQPIQEKQQINLVTDTKKNENKIMTFFKNIFSFFKR